MDNLFVCLGRMMKGKFKIIKIVSKIHGYVYNVSRGRLGKQIGKAEFILLTTTGRKSGKNRTVPLTGIPFQSKYILVASFGGSPVDPFWLVNIKHDHKVQIRVGSTVKRARASILETIDTEYEGMWTRAIAVYKGFDTYKRATARHIPIVVITPDEV
jgi:deazaflavin-dependent oxidoreductase (nitroreductase family)